MKSLLIAQEKYPDEAYSKVSIIIPTNNSALGMPRTLESILAQDYPEFEVIVIDASSLDRTIEVVKSYRDDRIRVYSVSYFHPFEMLNKGISLVTGDYINFLKPGDFYLSPHSLKSVMTKVLEAKNPDLYFSGSLLRIPDEDPTLFFNSLSLENLKIGKPPTFLESCFFNRAVFQKIGKFDTSYESMADFDLFCRFLREGLSFACTTQVFIDYDAVHVKREQVLKYFIDTWKIVYRNFGFADSMQWLMVQTDTKDFMKMTLKDIKKAFVGS